MISTNTELTGNCQPNRRPAALREVTKDTPNKGKFFWTCPIFNGCNFFLFWDEAKLREGGLNSTTLPEDQPPRPKTPTLTQPKLTSFGVQLTPGRRRQSRSDGEEQESPRGSQEQDSSAMTKGEYPSTQEMASVFRTPESAKRKRDAFAAPTSGHVDSEDEFSDFAVDSDDERQLIDLTDASAKKASASRAAPVTPETGTRTVAGLPTPSSVSRNLFPSEKGRRKSVSFEETTPTRRGVGGEEDNDSNTIVGDSSPLTTNSFNSTATLDNTVSAPGTPQVDPTSEVISLLSSHGVDTSVQRSVRGILAISARRTRGVEKSRDTLREELRRQKSRNAKLQDKIAALEDKLKMRSRSMTNLKAGLMELYEDN